MKTTHIILVLDSSGSMHSIAEQAVENYNEQVRSFKEAAKAGEVRVSLITFNTDVYEHLWEVPAEDLQECKHGDYIAEGWTSMLDAMGYGIQKILNTTNSNDPDNVYLMVVISDGQENHSTHYTRAKLWEMIDSLQRTNRWTFTFMGCNEDYIRNEAHNLGIPVANCAIWSNATPNLARMGFMQSNRRMASLIQSLTAGHCSASQNAYSDESKMAYFDAGNVTVNTPQNINVSYSQTDDFGTNIFSGRTKVDWTVKV